jgi:hypothetical protein
MHVTKTATDECGDLVTLAQIQLVHLGSGSSSEWHELATTARRLEDAAMRAARDEAKSA